jgi:ABC-type multidrug transport system ATPase subunit
MDEAEYCERVAIMRDGKLLAMDTPLNLEKEYYLWRCVGSVCRTVAGRLAVLPEVKGVLRVSLAGDHLRTITEKGKEKEDLLKALKAKGVNVMNIVAGKRRWRMCLFRWQRRDE